MRSPLNCLLSTTIVCGSVFTLAPPLATPLILMKCSHCQTVNGYQEFRLLREPRLCIILWMYRWFLAHLAHHECVFVVLTHLKPCCSINFTCCFCCQGRNIEANILCESQSLDDWNFKPRNWCDLMWLLKRNCHNQKNGFYSYWVLSLHLLLWNSIQSEALEKNPF